MTLPTNFKPSLLGEDPPELSEQLILLHADNCLFNTALKEKDIEALQVLLDKGIPYSSSILGEDGKKFINTEAINTFEEDYMNIFKYSIPQFIIKESADDILELLAQHFILRIDSIFHLFRQDYFAVTQQKDIALEYLQHLLSYDSLKSKKQKWIESALYNSSNEFFREFLEIYQNFDDITDNPIEPLAAHTTHCTIHKEINTDSFEHYFDFYFFTALSYQIEVSDYRILSDYTQQEAIDFLFHKILHTRFIEPTRIDKRIIDFLFQRFKELFPCLDEIEFFHLYLSYSNISDAKRVNEKMDKKTYIRGVAPAHNEKVLNKIKNNRIKLATDKMLMVLQATLDNNSPQKCYEQFVRMSISKDYYPELTRFVQISQSTPQRETLEKVKKI